MSTFYDVLGVPKTATLKEITKAYRKLCLLLHPDKHRADSPEEQERCKKNFQNVQDAYVVLSNPDARKTYDLHGSDRLPAAEYAHLHEVIIPNIAQKISDLAVLQEIYNIRQKWYEQLLVVRLGFKCSDQFFKAILEHLDYKKILSTDDENLEQFFFFLLMADHPVDKLISIMGAPGIDIYLRDIMNYIKNTQVVISTKEAFIALLRSIDNSTFSSVREGSRMRDVLAGLLLNFVHDSQDLHDIIRTLSEHAKREIARVLDHELKPRPGKNGNFLMVIGDKLYQGTPSQTEFVMSNDGVFSIGFDDELEPLEPKSAGNSPFSFFAPGVEERFRCMQAEGLRYWPNLY